jgi:hypothetical protein
MYKEHLLQNNFTQCSILEMKNNLFNYNPNLAVYTGIKSKYKCLLVNETRGDVLSSEVRHPYEIPMKKLINYKLLGFQYSLTHVCRQRTTNPTFNCHRDREKDKCEFIVYCLNGNTCHKNEFVIPDGTECGNNKICLLNECVDINELDIDQDEYERMYLIAKCSQGFDNSDAYKNLNSELYGKNHLPFIGINKSYYDYMKTSDFVSCKHFLQSKKAIELKVTCINDMFVYVCCEECIKFRIIKDKCSSKGCGKDFCNKYKPCYNNGKCVDNYKKKSFDCICSKGFKGK